MKNLRKQLQKLDREIAALDWKLSAFLDFGGKLKKKQEKLDERRKAVRLQRKKYVLPL